MTQTSCGNINGHVRNTDSYIKVEKIRLVLDAATAWALCNMLSDEKLNSSQECLDLDQIPGLSSLGSVIGRIIDHPSKDNLGAKSLIS